MFAPEIPEAGAGWRLRNLHSSSNTLTVIKAIRIRQAKTVEHVKKDNERIQNIGWQT
jgi:hypothetical protein